jgi:hypothetical protein
LTDLSLSLEIDRILSRNREGLSTQKMFVLLRSSGFTFSKAFLTGYLTRMSDEGALNVKSHGNAKVYFRKGAR